MTASAKRQHPVDVQSSVFDPLRLVTLGSLMQRTSGRPEVAGALLDGPVLRNRPGLSAASILDIRPSGGSFCQQLGSIACKHGTFITCVLSAEREGNAPSISPSCTLPLRPIFSEVPDGRMPAPMPSDVKAIQERVDASARVMNLRGHRSLVGWPPLSSGQEVEEIAEWATS